MNIYGSRSFWRVVQVRERFWIACRWMASSMESDEPSNGLVERMGHRYETMWWRTLVGNLRKGVESMGIWFYHNCAEGEGDELWFGCGLGRR